MKICGNFDADVHLKHCWNTCLSFSVCFYIKMQTAQIIQMFLGFGAEIKGNKNPKHCNDIW